MSTTFDEIKYPHQSRDGLFYATYEEMRDANVRANEMRLKELGLDKTSRDKRKREERQHRRSTGSIKRRKSDGASSSAASPALATRSQSTVRRSLRIRNVVSPDTVAATDEGQEPLLELDMEPKLRSRKSAPKRLSSYTTTRWMSETEREKLKKALELQEDKENNGDDDSPHWFEEMKTYLLEEENISDQNFRSVVNQLEKFLSGKGVTYKHWKNSTVYFLRNYKVQLFDDIEALYEEGIEYENEYGRDLGNGWLLRHPLKKLANFQRYYLEVLLPKKMKKLSSPSSSKKQGKRSNNKKN